MKNTRLFLLVLIIFATATPPTWAQGGPVKQQESEDAMTYLRLGVKHFMANLLITLRTTSLTPIFLFERVAPFLFTLRVNR